MKNDQNNFIESKQTRQNGQILGAGRAILASLALSLVLQPTNLHAVGGVSGGGGNGLVCFDSVKAKKNVEELYMKATNFRTATNPFQDPKILKHVTSVRSLDWYLHTLQATELVKQGNAELAKKQDTHAIVVAVLDKLFYKSSLGFEFANRYYNTTNEKESRFDTDRNYLNFNRWIKTDGLLPIEDTALSISPPYACVFAQIAVRQNVGNSTKIFYEPNLYNLMNAINQAALILHEIAYQYSADSGAKDASRVYDAVHLLFSMDDPLYTHSNYLNFRLLNLSAKPEASLLSRINLLFDGQNIPVQTTVSGTQGNPDIGQVVYYPKDAWHSNLNYAPLTLLKKYQLNLHGNYEADEIFLPIDFDQRSEISVFTISRREYKLHEHVAQVCKTEGCPGALNIEIGGRIIAKPVVFGRTEPRQTIELKEARISKEGYFDSGLVLDQAITSKPLSLSLKNGMIISANSELKVELNKNGELTLFAKGQNFIEAKLKDGDQKTLFRSVTLGNGGETFIRGSSDTN